MIRVSLTWLETGHVRACELLGSDVTHLLYLLALKSRPSKGRVVLLREHPALVELGNL